MRESFFDLSATNAWNESFSWSNASTLQLCEVHSNKVLKSFSRSISATSIVALLQMSSSRELSHSVRDEIRANEVANARRAIHRLTASQAYITDDTEITIRCFLRERCFLCLGRDSKRYSNLSVSEDRLWFTFRNAHFPRRELPSCSDRRRRNVCPPNRADKRSHDRGRSREIEGKCLR
jgi:hypothetical protein